MFRRCLGVLLAVTSAVVSARAGNMPSRETPILAMVGFPGANVDLSRLNWMFDREISRVSSQTTPVAPRTPAQTPLKETINFMGLPRKSYFEAPPPPDHVIYDRSFKGFTSHPERTDRYDPIILKYANLYGMDPRLIKAVIAAESGFHEQALSYKGARGLMQIVPRTASYFGVSSSRLFFGEDNIAAGSAYLASLFSNILKKLGLSRNSIKNAPAWVIRRVIAAYHAGPRFLKNKNLYRSTRNYVKKVMRFYHSPVSRIRNAPHLSPTARFIAEL